MTASVPRPRGVATLRVAFVQLGKEGGGVPRYARILSADAAAYPGIEADEVQAGTRTASLSDLRRAGRDARKADVIQIQWKLTDWGGGWRGVARLAWFGLFCRKPIVATLHDVYGGRRRRDRLLGADACALRMLGVRARRVIVHSEEERRRVGGLVPARKLVVIPHFAEGRPPLPEPGEARRKLGLEGRRVITLLGFITERKGHRLLLEALPLLAPDVSVVIAGAPIAGREFRRKELEKLADELGVTDRVVFTGYVGDEMLARVLGATDVAACPFKDVSASGSLSTWISAGTHIVASDLPAIREYDTLSAGAIHRFTPRTPTALAAALTDALADAAANPGPDPAVERLAETVSLPRTLARYAIVWRAAVGR